MQQVCQFLFFQKQKNQCYPKPTAETFQKLQSRTSKIFNYQKSEYDFHMHVLSVYSHLILVLIMMITQIICIIKTYNGMVNYLKKSSILSETTKHNRQEKNFIGFKSFLVLFVFDLFSFYLAILSKYRQLPAGWGNHLRQ